MGETVDFLFKNFDTEDLDIQGYWVE